MAGKAKMQRLSYRSASLRRIYKVFKTRKKCLFKSRYNTVLSPHCVNRAIDRIIKACNAKEKEEAKAEGREPELLPHFSCHHLRHTFCTRFCENETNLKVIQEIMGHADITTTMDIYNEATKDKKMESFAGLEGKIKIR